MPFIKTLRKEIIETIPAITFFIIAFNLINFTERLLLKADNLHSFYLSYVAATLGALVVGKIIIIVNSFSWINLFPKRPLIFNIVWKFCIYGTLTFMFRIFERFIHSVHEYKNTMIAVNHVLERLQSPLFWAIQLWILMVFSVYIVFSEYAKSLGEKRLLHLLVTNIYL